MPGAAFIDTNLFLVLLVGTVDRSLIGRFKRTDAYSVADLDLLVAELREFDHLVTTPSVLAEVSNHLGQLRPPAREQVRAYLASIAGSLHEQYAPSATLMADQEFCRLGLTDIAICDAAAPTHTVFTADLGLYLLLASRGIPVINFNHLRSSRFGL